ncbi:MAG TPA: hypothetical protein DEQ43_24270 [Nocardioides bacterium]|nr:hypothetical protein [Nocardioides sp.]
MRGEMSQYRIAEVAVTETDVELTLANGVRLAEPIRRYVRLEQAEPAQRQRWALTEDEHGVNWPGLVESTTSGVVTVWSLLQDRLYEAALDGLKQVGWQPNGLPPAIVNWSCSGVLRPTSTTAASCSSCAIGANRTAGPRSRRTTHSAPQNPLGWPAPCLPS